MLSGANPLLVVSVVLVAGTALGSLAKRIHLPAVSGQILVGILFGPSVLDLFDADSIHRIEPLIDFALGLMAVAVGSHLHFRRLRNAKKRLLLLGFEMVVTPALVFIVVAPLPGTSWQLALLLATVSISTAPATILAIVKETRSKGVFTKTLVAAVALNNLACITLFELAHTAVSVSLEGGADASMLGILGEPIRELIQSAAVGGGIAGLLIIFTRRVVRTDRLATASVIAILLTVGFAEYAGISALLSGLFLGITLANVTPDKEEIGHTVFANFESAIFAIFFTMAGMELRFGFIVPGGLLALLFFLARALGKIGSGYGAMRLAHATAALRRYVGIALIPQAGIAVGLMLLVTEDTAFPQTMRDLFLAVVLTAVLLSELIGPVLTRHALKSSGDFGKDRARLIDFLHEEHIVTRLEANTQEEAITRLVDLLVRTNPGKVDRDAFLDAVLAREKLRSTYLGDGLAIPHGELEDGEAILGVMGISSRGLRFPTPDGIPVHCMVLLATPTSQRDRHLEVLAAFARSIGFDRSIQQQLYHARSPAHAYDLLHAEEESEEFNYFLENDAPA